MITTIKKLLHEDLIHFDDRIKTDNLLRHALKKVHNVVNINANFYYDKELVDSLTDEDIDKLIRIILLYENFNFIGSATAIPNLLNKLKQRQYKDLASLFNWIIETNAGNNPYIPMQTMRGKEIDTIEKYLSASYC